MKNFQEKEVKGLDQVVGGIDVKITLSGILDGKPGTDNEISVKWKQSELTATASRPTNVLVAAAPIAKLA